MKISKIQEAVYLYKFSANEQIKFSIGAYMWIMP